MGNTKVYTFRCPLFRGETLISRQELADAARSSLIMIQAELVGFDGEQVVMGMVESSSQNADQVIEFVRTRYPKRWCLFTRFDADWPDFRVISWNSADDKPPEVRIADNWHEPRE